MSINTYNDGSTKLTAAHGNSDYFRISPSSVSDFFSSTRKWYGEKLLNEPGFIGNNSTVLGTVIHHFAELASKGIPFPDNHLEQVLAYIATQDIPLDRSVILDNYQNMSETLIEEYVKPNIDLYHSQEQFIYHEILPGVFAAGTYDALLMNDLQDGNLQDKTKYNSTYRVLDYKSSNRKPSSGISYSYRMQAHVYAYILRQKGFMVNEIELAYIVQPTKTLGPRVFSFIEPFTDDDYLRIESQLQLIAHSVQTWKTKPELRFLLAQDLRLRLPEPAPLFKN